MWQNDIITFAQHNHLFRYCLKPIPRRFISDTNKFYLELGKLTKGQAAQAMGLFKSSAGYQALLKLKDFGCSVSI